MTDCIRLTQLVRFLNQTIYKLKLAAGTPPEQELFLCYHPLLQLHKEQMSDLLSQAFLCLQADMKTCHL